MRLSDLFEDDGRVVSGLKPASDGPWAGDQRHLEEIMAAVKSSPYRYYALRVMTPHPDENKVSVVGVGDTLNSSYRWNDGYPTKRQLKGTSGIGFRTKSQAIEAIRRLSLYYGQQVVLMGGNEQRCGADEGEKVIRDARVLRTWQRQKAGVGRALLPHDHSDYE